MSEFKDNIDKSEDQKRLERINFILDRNPPASQKQTLEREKEELESKISGTDVEPEYSMPEDTMARRVEKWVKGDAPLIDPTEGVAGYDPEIEKPKPKTEDKPEDPSLGSNIEKAEQLAAGGNPPKTYAENLRELATNVGGRNKELLGIMEQGYAEIRSDEEGAKKQAQVGKLIKSLMNAAALVYAAKQGIQADLKLAEPDIAIELKDIERDYDLKRMELQKKLQFLRKRDDDITNIISKDISATAAGEARKTAAKAKLDAANKKIVERHRKDILKAIAANKGEDEDMRSALEATGMDSETAKDISGDTRSIFWDSQLEGDELNAAIDNYLKTLIGGSTSEAQIPQGAHDRVPFTDPDGRTGYVYRDADGSVLEKLYDKKKVSEDKPSYKESDLKSGKFDDAVASVLNLEGGMSNRKDDKGGLTKFGIAQNIHKNVDVANLTKDEALKIYEDQYWKPIRGDELDKKAGYFIFDQGVNKGVGDVIPRVREVLGLSKEFLVDDEFVSAVNNYEGDLERALRKREAINYARQIKHNDEQRAAGKKVRNQRSNIHGWFNRAKGEDIYGNHRINLKNMTYEELLENIEENF